MKGGWSSVLFILAIFIGSLFIGFISALASLSDTTMIIIVVFYIIGMYALEDKKSK